MPENLMSGVVFVPGDDGLEIVGTERFWNWVADALEEYGKPGAGEVVMAIREGLTLIPNGR